MNVSFLKSNNINQLVWLGAGDLAKSDLIVNSKATVHLVDADEAAIARLQKRYKDKKNVIIHSLLIADSQKNADFIRYSLPEFNGIAKPAKLKQRYPGIKQLQSENKPATAITDFFANIKLNTQQKNTLIIDLPGLSSTLIQTLINSNALHVFNQLLVLTNQQSLFDGELLAGDLTKLLEKNGFLCQTHQSNYQDYSIVQAELNPLHIELTATKNQLQNAQAELKQLQAKQDEKDAEANKQKQQQQEQQEQITLLNQQKVDLTEQLEQKQTNYQTQLAQLQANKDELNTQLQERQQQYAKDQQELTELNAQLREMHKKLGETEDIKKAIEVIRKERDEQKAAKEKLEKEYVAAEQSHAHKLNELKTKHNTLQDNNQQLEQQSRAHIVQLQQLKEELAKAEAQITVIKDIFFRDTEINLSTDD